MDNYLWLKQFLIEYKEILFLLLVDGRTAPRPGHPTQRVRSEERTPFRCRKRPLPLERGG
ncbi:MAG: hypothetical protein F6K48_07285 [Okeania sp. SIO3H1]|nr:hypothetical protein [Okeania sp. SIO3H1]